MSLSLGSNANATALAKVRGLVIPVRHVGHAASERTGRSTWRRQNRRGTRRGDVKISVVFRKVERSELATSTVVRKAATNLFSSVRFSGLRLSWAIRTARTRGLWFSRRYTDLAGTRVCKRVHPERSSVRRSGAAGSGSGMRRWKLAHTNASLRVGTAGWSSWRRRVQFSESTAATVV